MLVHERGLGPAVIAYLLAVCAGCVVVGSPVGIYDLIWGQRPPAAALLFYITMAPLLGLLPGVVLALPGFCVGVWIRRSRGELATAWYWLLGLLNGLLISFILGWLGLQRKRVDEAVTG